MSARVLKVYIRPKNDGNTRDGRLGSLPGPNGKRPSSLNILAKTSNKRKASDLEEKEDTYNNAHIHLPIKQEPASPMDDSRGSSGRSEPPTVPIKQEQGTDDVSQGRDNHNGSRGRDSSRPSSDEADPPDHNVIEANDVEDGVSSSDLTEPDNWDVSESDLYTSEAEEVSSDSESAQSAFSSGMERQDNGNASGRSQGPYELYREESDQFLSRKGPVQDENTISRKGPTGLSAKGSSRTEQDITTRSLPHGHDSHARDNHSDILGNRLDPPTTVSGKPRQRALAKTHMTARDISRSWNTARPEDKMLIEMKEKGCEWLEIRKAWQELTGQWPAASTLPNRYSRIKDNLTRLKKGDAQRLLDAAAAVESRFQREKWRLIAEAMEAAGAAKYSHAFIQKKYDDLSKNPNIFDSLVENECSDSPETDPGPRGDNVARHIQPRTDLTTLRPTARESIDEMSLADPLQPGSQGELKFAISHKEAKYMARHRALNASNRAKSWKLIAQECGINVALNDIIHALRRDGYLEGGSSIREAGVDRSARMSPSGERRRVKRTKVLHAAVPEEITASNSRPYECEYCLKRYKKRVGMLAHWKNMPGCDPERRRRKAAKTVRKETASEGGLATSEKEVAVGNSSFAHDTQMVFESSSEESTPEMGG